MQQQNRTETSRSVLQSRGSLLASTAKTEAPGAAGARTIDEDDTLLTGPATRARVGGVSDMCIWRWQRDSRVNFPQPIKINGRNYWRLGDLRRWQAEQQNRAA